MVQYFWNLGFNRRSVTDGRQPTINKLPEQHFNNSISCYELLNINVFMCVALNTSKESEKKKKMVHKNHLITIFQNFNNFLCFTLRYQCTSMLLALYRKYNISFFQVTHPLQNPRFGTIFIDRSGIDLGLYREWYCLYGAE